MINLSPEHFDYEEAFSRNIGWVTIQEQSILQEKVIAIAGMGGVGGLHLLTLARLGIGRFKISDFDQFELANINRQVGATLSTIGQHKAQTLKNMAQEINPTADVTLFDEGISADNIDVFLNDVDIFVDGLDFFAMEAREKVFSACYEKGIPAITAAPLGMGCAYLIFLPQEMTFESYFRLNGKTELQKYIQFMIGLTPRAPHRNYLVQKDRINLAARRGPSTIMGCELCASITGTEVLKMLLKRGPVLPAPYYHVFDAYQQYMKHGKLRGGNNHPLQRLKAYLIEKEINKGMD